VEQFLQLSERRYYNVKLWAVNIPKRTRSNYEQYQVVEKISESVRVLRVYNSTIGDIGLKFPKLEELFVPYKMSWKSTKQILNGVTASKLKSFIGKTLKSESNELKAFLMKCNKLENLFIMDSTKNGFFEAEALFPFKLKVLFLNANFFTASMLPNFEKFLRSQSSSLEYSLILNFNTDIVEIVLKSLPLLKFVGLLMHNELEPRELPLNTSVMKLFVKSNISFLSIILAALPNLRTLVFDEIDDIHMVDIISSSMNLQNVHYKKSNVDVAEYYATFRQMNPNVNQIIQWTKYEGDFNLTLN